MGKPAARTAAVAFLWLQAGLIGGWWVWLWLSPDAREWFAFPDWPEGVALAFFVPDLAVLVLGAAVVALAVQRETRWAMHAFGAVVGSAIYATLFCVGAAALGHGNTLCLALMLLLCVADIAAFALVRHHRVVRKRATGAA